jgi:hypothetical protein
MIKSFRRFKMILAMAGIGEAQLTIIFLKISFTILSLTALIQALIIWVQLSS